MNVQSPSISLDGHPFLLTITANLVNDCIDRKQLFEFQIDQRQVEGAKGSLYSQEIGRGVDGKVEVGTEVTGVTHCHKR